MSSVEKVQKVSLETYLEMEDAGVEKSEFHDGEVFAMAGGSYAHGVIAGNMLGALFAALKHKDCRANTSDVKVHIEAANSMVYPDVTVVCGSPEFDWSRKDSIRNPTLIAEVLSPENEGYDRGGKFRKYKLLPSLREYVLVDQESANVDVLYLTEEGLWTLQSCTGLEQHIHLQSLGVELAMADVYRGVF